MIVSGLGQQLVHELLTVSARSDQSRQSSRHMRVGQENPQRELPDHWLPKSPGRIPVTTH
jgi:hypothetical protein